jgi:archaellum biogenesis protein FlaJ (TadC family)
VTGQEVGGLGALDRGLYALFSRHADNDRHDTDRRRYRAAALRTTFEVYLSRVYGISWGVLLVTIVLTVAVVTALPESVLTAATDTVHSALPVLNRVEMPDPARRDVALALALVVGLFCKRATVWCGGLRLRWAANARRTDIERTLPGAVRYLRVLASGSDDRETMLRTVAQQNAYGETGAAFRTALHRASLTGSLDRGLETVARDTPSRDLLAPFLLKFREHANQGADALEGYLRMESRMLSHRQARARQRATGFLELVSELFVVLLVLPALLVIVVTVMSVLAPGLGRPVPTPLGTTTVRALVVYANAVFVLAVGAGAAMLVVSLRPRDQEQQTYRHPGTVRGIVATAGSNPASALVVAAPLTAVAAGVLFALGYDPMNVLLLSYAVLGVSVGLVAARRARRDDAKDRELKDFVHAVSRHVGLGRPFGEAVELVARDVELGALQEDVDDLAFTMGLTTGTDGGDVNTAALREFTDSVGTPLAEQTVGLVTGALDAGSDTETVFETLQTEVGRLYHERKELRSAMLVYVAVGWTTALLVVGIVVAVNAHVLEGFAQLSNVGPDTAVGIVPDAVDPARDRQRFYVVTQATMVACGWFAGAASRGRYDALLHSGLLVLVCYGVFAGMGMV